VADLISAILGLIASFFGWLIRSFIKYLIIDLFHDLVAALGGQILKRVTRGKRPDSEGEDWLWCLLIGACAMTLMFYLTSAIYLHFSG